MNTSDPMSESFEETFCAQYGVPPELYGATVLRLTLYPHARWLADVSPHHFLAPDRYFIVSVGRLKRWREFAAEAELFQNLAANSRFWRRHLRLRVSLTRMRVLFSEVMGGRPNDARKQDEARSDPGSFATG